ncbi:MAG TPA: hypothetical protein VNT42_13130 [Sphingomonas sp.]|nr:hypothetical protein [Sphingomonas sp.]
MLDLMRAPTDKRLMEGEGPTALIGAYEPGPGPGGLRALHPLAGMSVVEHQARRAIDAGAGRILLLIDEAPAELSEAIARLRHDGIQAGMAQGIDQAADALPQDGTVLLIAEGCLPEVALLRAIVGAPVPALATLPDIPQHGQFERIDAEQRWAGVALLDGHRIAETAAMIGAWDPVSTLLRRAVQEGAARIAAPSPPILATDPAALAAAEQAILAGARRPAGDLIGRVLFSPTEEFALPLLLARRTDANLVAGIGAGLALAGGALSVVGWSWAALVALLLSGPAAAGAARLARIGQRTCRQQRVFTMARIGGATVGAIGLAQTLAGATGQWGWWLTGGILIGTMLALWVDRRTCAVQPPLWLASVDTLIWAMLPFAAIGRWEWGFAASAGYATSSFAYGLWRKSRDTLPIE